jgi:hypothetical protein
MGSRRSPDEVTMVPTPARSCLSTRVRGNADGVSRPKEFDGERADRGGLWALLSLFALGAVVGVLGLFTSDSWWNRMSSAWLTLLAVVMVVGCWPRIQASRRSSGVCAEAENGESIALCRHRSRRRPAPRPAPN